MLSGQAEEEHTDAEATSISGQPCAIPCCLGLVTAAAGQGCMGLLLLLRGPSLAKRDRNFHIKAS